MLGLSIDGPGNRTADPVPHDVTWNPASLMVSDSYILEHSVR